MKIATNCRLAIATAFVFLMSDVFAQDENAEDDTDLEYEDGVLEEIVVTGMRNSLMSAAELKRDSSIIVDSIVAEDIGKFPDENVAESLQRIPGVTIDRGQLGAEGNSVSIRGLGPDFNRVFIDGRSVLNTGTGRQVNFQDLPSEMVSQLDVYKSPMASLIEGAIGGTVMVRTTKPFDNGGEFLAAGSAQAIYNDLAEEWKPRLSGLISNAFADGTLGVLFGINYQDRITRQDTFDVPGWQCVDVTLDNPCPGSLVDVPLEDRYFRARFPRQFMRVLESERWGINGAIQWQPTDNAKLEFDVWYQSRDDVESQATFITGTFSNLSDIVPGSEVVNENNTVIAMDVISADLRGGNRTISTDNDSLVVGLFGEITADLWTFSGDIGYSEGKSELENLQSQIFRQLNGTWDYRTDSGIPTFYMDEVSDNPTLTTGWTFNNFRNQVTDRKQDELNIRADIKRDFDSGGFFDSVEFGGRYTDGGLDQDAFGWFLNVRPRPAVESIFDPSVALQPTSAIFGINDFGASLPDNQSVYADWVISPFEGVLDYFLPGDPRTNIDWANSITIQEKTTAAYLQTSFSGEMGRVPWSGNIGLRYVKTKVKTTGGSTVPEFENLQEGEYDDWLPSLNLRFDLTDEFLLRFALNKVMSRPSYNDLDPGTTVNVTTFTGTAGNPNLEPFRANQFDASLEWYFGQGNLLSFAYFYKDVESFVQTETIFTKVDPVLTAGIDPDTIFAISRPGNGEGAKINGFELTYQQAFYMLPPGWDGLGLVATYTYTDTDASQTNSLVGVEVGLEGLSKNAYNITGYWEKNKFGARVAYNWRDEFLRFASGLGGTPEFGNSYGQWDAQMFYNLNEHWTFILEGKNLNNEIYRSYEYLDERMRTVNTSGRRYFLGARFKY
ncbi:TonB-dependent receptor [Pseudomonadota bacterium]